MSHFPHSLRLAAAIAMAAALAGCATFGSQDGGAAASAQGRPAAASVNAGFDFNWSVSGDSAVRPVQVFSDAEHTYIQMRPGQFIPAVIVDGAPVPFALSPPDLVVAGDPARIDLLYNGYRAVLINGSPLLPQQPHDLSRVHFVALDALGDPVASTVPMRPVPNAAVEPGANPQSVAPVTSPDVQTTWYVSSGDRLLSKALSAMLSQHGQHLMWETNVDLPVMRTFGVRANDSLSALAKILAIASRYTGYRFFFSIRGDTYVVTAQKA